MQVGGLLAAAAAGAAILLLSIQDMDALFIFSTGVQLLRRREALAR